MSSGDITTIIISGTPNPVTTIIASGVTNQASSVEVQIGARGASAYEVAVQNGFSGTQSEWLTSLSVPSTGDFSLNNKFGPTQLIASGDIRLIETGNSFIISGDLANVSSLTGEFVRRVESGLFIDFDKLVATSGFIVSQIPATGSFADQTFVSNVSGALRISITGLDARFYPLTSNPSGYLLPNQTGQLVDLAKLLATSGALISGGAAGTTVNGISGAVIITGVGISVVSVNGSQILISGDLSSYADKTYVSTSIGDLSGVYYPLLSNPNGYLTSLSPTGTLTGAFYPLDSNPLGYLNSLSPTGSLTRAFYPLIGNPSGFLIDLNGTGVLTGQFVNRSETGQFAVPTGDLTGAFYPLLTNPNGYLTSLSPTGALTGQFISRSETGVYTGIFYPLSSNPAGYLTSLSATGSLTGAFYPLNTNPLGYLTNLNGTGVLTGQFLNRSETGSLTGAFYPLSSNPSNYLTSLSPTGALTGQFVNRSETGQFASVAFVNLTSGNLQSTINGLSSVYYPLSSNPAGYLTSLSATGALTGEFVQRSESGQFASAANLVLTGAKIDTLSGYADSTFYLKSNPNSYCTSGNLAATGALLSAAVPFSRGGTITNTTVATGNYIVWRSPFACTVTGVHGYRVGGTSATVNARKNGSSNHLSADLSLSSTDTWISSGIIANQSYVAGDKLEIMITAVGGLATQIAVQVDFTKP